MVLVLIGARFGLSISLAQILFWMHSMELLGDVGHVESHFSLFGDIVCMGAK